MIKVCKFASQPCLTCHVFLQNSSHLLATFLKMLETVMLMVFVEIVLAIDMPYSITKAEI